VGALLDLSPDFLCPVRLKSGVLRVSVPILTLLFRGVGLFTRMSEIALNVTIDRIGVGFLGELA